MVSCFLPIQSKLGPKGTARCPSLFEDKSRSQPVCQSRVWLQVCPCPSRVGTGPPPPGAHCSRAPLAPRCGASPGQAVSPCEARMPSKTPGCCGGHRALLVQAPPPQAHVAGADRGGEQEPPCPGRGSGHTPALGAEQSPSPPEHHSAAAWLALQPFTQHF